MTTESSTTLSTADFGTRFSAFMVDAGLLFAAQWAIFIVMSRQLQAVGLTSTEPCAPNSVALCEGPSTLLWALLLILFVGSTVAYHAVFEGIYGTTPGKRWMRLAVVDRNGFAPIGLLAATLRSVVRQSFWLSLLFVFDVSPLGLGLPPVLFIGLPLLMLAVFVRGALHPDGLAIHDLVAKTQVVRADHARTWPTHSTASHDSAEAEEAEEAV